MHIKRGRERQVKEPSCHVTKRSRSASSETGSHLSVLAKTIYTVSLVYEERIFHGLEILSEIFLYTYSCLRNSKLI